MIFVAAATSKIYTEEALAIRLQFRRVPIFFCHRFLTQGRASRVRALAYSAALGSWAAFFLLGQTAAASPSHRPSVTAYSRAENIHLRLEEKPVASRTRGDYERALDAYRAVYHGNPASPDAGRSIAEVADLLASEGRCFHDAKLSHDAVAQWEFLRSQYPTSSLRQRALYEEAEIERHDLHDRATANKIYRQFLKRYPQDELAEQARSGLRGEPLVEAKGRRSRSADSKAAASVAPAPAISLEHTRATHAAEYTNTALRPVTVSGHSFSNASPAPASFSVAAQTAATPQPTTTIHGVRYWAEGNTTRIAVDLSHSAPCRLYPTQDGRQITLIFFGSQPAGALLGHSIAVSHDANLRSMRVSALTDDQTALVLQLNHPMHVLYFSLSNPARLIVDLRPAMVHGTLPQSVAQANPPADSKDSMPPTGMATQLATYRGASAGKFQTASEKQMSTTAPNDMEQAASPSLPANALSPEPATNGQQSMMRVLGLRVRRIVIDAGHGGHDSGTVGPDGLEEKDVALDVALRLGHLLQQRLGADVVYTRRTDKFVPLEERTAIANRAHADLFLSIHANSSSDPEVRGVETYFLNFTASPGALEVAARENATSNRSVYELSDLVRRITLSNKIDESREFADDVQQSLYTGLVLGNPGLKNRGVKQAPFVVLIGANMPSVLAEISFLTNPKAAREMRRPAYRERLAESLYRGVSQYVQGVSGIRVAKTTEPETLPAPAE